MRLPIPRRPRYADVASTLALLLAVSGTAYAAATVDTADIKDGAVTTPKLHGGAVTSSKIELGAVSNGKLAASAVTAGKLAPSAVTGSKIAPGAVTTGALADNAVTHAKLALGSVNGSNVANQSLTLADLRGIDESGTISFSLGAGACGTLNLAVTGAVAGQAALLTWTGAVPTHVVLGPLKVVSSTKIITQACNLGTGSISPSGIGVRVITFG